MRKGITQLAQGRASSFQWGLDQSQPAGQGHLGADGTQGPIRQEEAVTTEGARGHQGLQQVRPDSDLDLLVVMPHLISNKPPQT